MGCTDKTTALREALKVGAEQIVKMRGRDWNDEQEVQTEVNLLLTVAQQRLATSAAPLPLQAHEEAIADLQLADHVLKMLKAYGITVPEEALPDFEMQLSLEMGAFRGEFRGHRAAPAQPDERNAEALLEQEQRAMELVVAQLAERDAVIAELADHLETALLDVRAYRDRDTRDYEFERDAENLRVFKDKAEVALTRARAVIKTEGV